MAIPLHRKLNEMQKQATAISADCILLRVLLPQTGQYIHSTFFILLSPPHIFFTDLCVISLLRFQPAYMNTRKFLRSQILTFVIFVSVP